MRSILLNESKAKEYRIELDQTVLRKGKRVFDYMFFGTCDYIWKKDVRVFFGANVWVKIKESFCIFYWYYMLKY